MVVVGKRVKGFFSAVKWKKEEMSCHCGDYQKVGRVFSEAVLEVVE